MSTITHQNRAAVEDHRRPNGQFGAHRRAESNLSWVELEASVHVIEPLTLEVVCYGCATEADINPLHRGEGAWYLGKVDLCPDCAGEEFADQWRDAAFDPEAA